MALFLSPNRVASALVTLAALAVSLHAQTPGYRIVASCPSGVVVGQVGKFGYPTMDVNGQPCVNVPTAPSLPQASCVALNDSAATDTLVKVSVNKVVVTSYLLVAADTVSWRFLGGSTPIEGWVRFEGSKGEGVAWTQGPFATPLDSDLILVQSRTVALGGHVCYLLQ